MFFSYILYMLNIYNNNNNNNNNRIGNEYMNSNVTLCHHLGISVFDVKWIILKKINLSLFISVLVNTASVLMLF